MLKNVLIGTNVPYTTTATNPSQLTAGQIGVFSVAADGTYSRIDIAIDAAQALLPIVIAQGTPAGKNVKMFTIQPKEKRAYLNTTYLAPKPNVFVAGYDGVTAAYNVVSGAAGTYDFKVQNLTYGNPPFPTVGSTPFFQTIAAATPIAIVSAIVKDVNSQMLLSNNDVMPAQRFAFAEILSTVSTAPLVSTPTATVTNGSTTVILSASSTSVAPGVYLRFGSSMTPTTIALYKVLAVSGTTVTLDSAYVNSEIAVGASIAGLATAFVATVGSSNCGIRVTEYGNTFNGSNVLEPMPNKIMNVSCSSNLSGTPVQNNQIVAKDYTSSTGAPTSGVYTEGNGTYPQIFKKELTAAGYGGFINRIFLPDNFPLYSVSGGTYDTIGLQYGTSVTDYTAQGYKAGETLDAIIAVPYASTGNQFATLATILSSANW
jgi:hypothetical protein